MKAFARATFQGYKSQPGEIQLRMPAAPIEVEVFRFRADTWKARAVHGGGIFKGIEGPVEVAMRQTVERFDQIIKPWQWVDEDGDPAEAANEPNLRHLLGAPKDQQQFPRIRRTLCGKTVMAHRIAHRLEDANCAPCRLALTNMPAE
jgi:hypothetical protein